MTLLIAQIYKIVRLLFGHDRAERFRQYFYFLSALVRRDLKARYRRSALGHVWAILQPLLLMLVWVMVRSFFSIPSEGVPYVVFVYSGIVLWTYFASIVTGCAPAIQSNAGIIKKIRVPREIFILVAMITATYDFVMSFGVLAVLMLFYKVDISWYVMLVPLFVFATALMALGVGMLVSAIGVFQSDIVLATGFLLQVWMFLSPVIYPLTSVPEKWKGIYTFLNPFVGIIDNYRRSLIFSQAPNWGTFSFSIFGAIIIFLIAWPFFRKRAQFFADVI